MQGNKSNTENLQKENLRLNAQLNVFKKKNRLLLAQNSQLKNSFSWKISFPIRLFSKLLSKILNLFTIIFNDIGIGYEILKRDGIKLFTYRLNWYFKGKRLKEDIEIHLNKSQFHEKLDFSNQIVFKRVPKPKVSIIIPVFNQFEHTYRCLHSIKENTLYNDYEVILIDDCSDDKTIKLKELAVNIKYVRNEKNLGFIKSCNKAASDASGEFIHLLNNDTIVHENWLSSLVDLINSDHRIAIVGSKLIFPDGRLQEAGGIIWNDASGWNYGKYDDAEKSDYNYIKEVDYVSGASILVRKDFWEETGGFDESFSPAYFEDTDLAFQARMMDFKVMYQPFSVVTHFEGLSNGTDENSGVKKYLAVNREKFLKKWNDIIKNDSGSNGENVFFHRDRSLTKKHVLIIDHYVPHFDQDAGSRCIYNYLQQFIKLDYQVHFLGDNLYRHQPYTKLLQQMGVEVYYGDFYKKNIRSFLKQNLVNFDLVISNRMHISIKYLDLIKKYCKSTTAYIGHDLEFLSAKRKFEVTGDIRHQKNITKFKALEKKIFEVFDIILPFSTLEEKFIKEMAPDKIVETVPVYFFDKIPDIKYSFHERKDLLFVGFFKHPPNVDAVIWFCKEIFPKVQEKIPDITINIVGSNPTIEIQELRCESINITDYIPDEELERYYNKSRLAVLPLRMGAGVKGKLLESYYYRIPSVITPVAAEGIPDVDNYSVIASDEKVFANEIIELYQDEKKWNKYSEKSSEIIYKHFTKDAAERKLSKIFKD